LEARPYQQLLLLTQLVYEYNLPQFPCSKAPVSKKDVIELVFNTEIIEKRNLAEAKIRLEQQRRDAAKAKSKREVLEKEKADAENERRRNQAEAKAEREKARKNAEKQEAAKAKRRQKESFEKKEAEARARDQQKAAEETARRNSENQEAKRKEQEARQREQAEEAKRKKQEAKRREKEKAAAEEAKRKTQEAAAEEARQKKQAEEAKANTAAYEQRRKKAEENAKENERPLERPFVVTLQPTNISIKRFEEGDSHVTQSPLMWVREDETRDTGSCAYDSVFNSLFAVPNTFLMQRITQAKEVWVAREEAGYKDANRLSPADYLHQEILKDIKHIREGSDREQKCLSRKLWNSVLDPKNTSPLKPQDASELVVPFFEFYPFKQPDMELHVNVSEFVKQDEKGRIALVQYAPYETERAPIVADSDSLVAVLSVQADNLEEKPRSGVHFVAFARTPRCGQWTMLESMI
jgi:chemotaxis protein histidine kinase CheA